MLKEATQAGRFNAQDMFNILRHKESGICRSCDDTFPTQGSQVNDLLNEKENLYFTHRPNLQAQKCQKVNCQILKTGLY